MDDNFFLSANNPTLQHLNLPLFIQIDYGEFIDDLFIIKIVIKIQNSLITR